MNDVCKAANWNRLCTNTNKMALTDMNECVLYASVSK